MPSILPDFEYDIFISYRQNDNKADGWVTAFVTALRAELEATLKNPVSIYIDENAADGLLETHQVEASLSKKLKCIIFMPIVSQTYCDTGSYAWKNEFLAFIKQTSSDRIGLNITLSNGNVVSRVLPIQIHELDAQDRKAIESALGGPLRSIPFTYAAPGVNRPLQLHEDHPDNNRNRTIYRDQINKVANAIKEIGAAVLRLDQGQDGSSAHHTPEGAGSVPHAAPWRKVNITAAAILILTIASYYLFFKADRATISAAGSSVAVIPFRNNTGDPSMSHYGVGIAQEVSTQLGLTKQFEFISSLQATIQYQQSDKPPAAIGRELGVTHMLTGMYQTAGENMQVTVELLDAEGKVLWTIPYRTRYTDIFEVQQKIASQVKNRFDIKETSEAPFRAPDLEAYTHVIKALEIILKSNRPEDRMKAIPEYQQAIALDSGFIEPWWGIIEEYCYYYWNRTASDSLTLEMIQPYMAYVEERFPDSWKKKSVRATYTYWAEAKYQEGLNLFLEVIDEVPQNSGARSMVAAIYRRQLKLSEALKHLSVSLKESPSGVIYWNELMALAQMNGDYENALQAAATIYSFNESLSANLYRFRNWTGTLDQLPEKLKQLRSHILKADQLLHNRDYEGLRRYVEKDPEARFTKESLAYYRVVASYLLRRDNDVKKFADQYFAHNDRNIGRLSDVLAITGKEAAFIEALRRPGGNLEEDLSLQWSNQSNMLSFMILSGKYAEATKALVDINQKFPQVGDYGWLNLPIYNRIKSEYPPFVEALNQLKMPPRIMDTKLIRI